MPLFGGGFGLGSGYLLGGGAETGAGPTPPPAGDIEVAMDGKHPALIAVAMQYVNADGDTVWGNPTVFTYDVPLVARLTAIGVRYLGTGEVLPRILGDEDVVSAIMNVGIGAPPADPTAGVHDAAVAGNDGEATATGKFAAYGDFVYVAARGIDKNGVLGPTKLSAFHRGDTSKQAPRVHASATRSADQIVVTIIVDDATRAVTSIQYKKRTGSDPLDSSWQDVWDIGGSGVIGTNTHLVRIRTITAADGLDGEFDWRVNYTNENGVAEEIGHTIYLSNLRQQSKTLHIPATEFIGLGLDHATVIGAAIPAAIGDAVGQASIVLPLGTEMTEARVRVHAWTASDSAEIWVHRLPSSPIFGAGTFTLPDDLAHEPAFTAGGIGSGNFTKVFPLSETVSEKYSIQVALHADAVVTDAAIFWAEVDYDMPTYEFTR